MTWIDTIIITAIVIVGLFILYRGLKEPLDHLFSLIGAAFGAVRDKMSDTADSGYEVIRYG